MRATALRNKRTVLGKCVLKAPKIPPWIPTRFDLGSLGTQVEPTLRWCLRPWCRAAALNPNVSDRMLQQLAQDASSDVQKAANGSLRKK